MCTLETKNFIPALFKLILIQHLLFSSTSNFSTELLSSNTHHRDIHQLWPLHQLTEEEEQKDNHITFIIHFG